MEARVYAITKQARNRFGFGLVFFEIEMIEKTTNGVVPVVDSQKFTGCIQPQDRNFFSVFRDHMETGIEYQMISTYQLRLVGSLLHDAGEFIGPLSHRLSLTSGMKLFNRRHSLGSKARIRRHGIGCRPSRIRRVGTP